jgi:hypothetical protein
VGRTMNCLKFRHFLANCLRVVWRLGTSDCHELKRITASCPDELYLVAGALASIVMPASAHCLTRSRRDCCTSGGGMLSLSANQAFCAIEEQARRRTRNPAP